MFFLHVVVPLFVGGTTPAPAAPAPAPTTTPAAPTAPSAASTPTPPSAASTPTAPTSIPTPTWQDVPVDPSTGQPLLTDPATGLLIVPRDPTTGLPIPLVDESGQPLVLRDETGQPLPTDTPPPAAADSLLRPEGSGVGSFGPGSVTDRSVKTGGTRYHARVGFLQGYTSNAVQTQSVLNGPVTTHAAIFGGLEGSVDLLTWTGEADQQDFRIAGRLQHYVPFDGYGQVDDGTVNASWGGAFTLGKRTIAAAHVIGTLTSSNSALLSDGPLFQVDPSTLTHVYTLENARLSVTHELSRAWRVTVGVDSWLGTTVSEAPIALPAGGQIIHSGLDYVTPEADIALNHDFGPGDIGSLILRDTESFVAFVVDYSKTPPTYNGTAWNQQATLLANWNHAFTERLRVLLGAGGSVAQPPPLDPDQQVILSPSANALIVYQRPYWLAMANGSYSYGSANPRIGFGPSQGGGFTLQGIPYPYGTWNRLSVLANGSASYSTFAQGGGVNSALIGAGGGVEGRYAVNTWLGVVAGYNAIYTELQGGGASAPVVRNIGFVGLVGYFANDGTLPTLQQFAVSTSPPG